MRTLTVALVSLSALALVACTDPENQDVLQQTPAVSDCGGFFGTSAKLAKSPMGDPATYCEAELLLWSYSAETETLALANNRTELNCCGDHSMDVSLVDGTYVVTETDAPEATAGGARCGCMCVFDFTTEVTPVATGSIPVRLIRNVTDSEEGPVTVWEGTFDLSAGSGSVTLDASETMWCTPPAA